MAWIWKPINSPFCFRTDHLPFFFFHFFFNRPQIRFIVITVTSRFLFSLLSLARSCSPVCLLALLPPPAVIVFVVKRPLMAGHLLTEASLIRKIRGDRKRICSLRLEILYVARYQRREGKIKIGNQWCSVMGVKISRKVCVWSWLRLFFSNSKIPCCSYWSFIQVT